jgi:hypothetical protein
MTTVDNAGPPGVLNTAQSPLVSTRIGWRFTAICALACEDAMTLTVMV